MTTTPTAAPAVIPRELLDQAAAEIAQIDHQDAERSASAGLQPCRCGAAPRLIDREHSKTPQMRGAWIECRACGMSTSIKPTVAEAISTWQPAQAPAAASGAGLTDEQRLTLEFNRGWDAAMDERNKRDDAAAQAAPAAAQAQPLTPERVAEVMAATHINATGLSLQARTDAWLKQYGANMQQACADAWGVKLGGAAGATGEQP